MARSVAVFPWTSCISRVNSAGFSETTVSPGYLAASANAVGSLWTMCSRLPCS